MPRVGVRNVFKNVLYPAHTTNNIRQAAIEPSGLRALGYPVDTSIEISPAVEHQGLVKSTLSFLDYADSLLSEDMGEKTGAFLNNFDRFSGILACKSPDLN